MFNDNVKYLVHFVDSLDGKTWLCTSSLRQACYKARELSRIYLENAQVTDLCGNALFNGISAKEDARYQLSVRAYNCIARQMVRDGLDLYGLEVEAVHSRPRVAHLIRKHGGLRAIRGCGSKTIVEIYSWLGPTYRKALAKELLADAQNNAHNPLRQLAGLE